MSIAHLIVSAVVLVFVVTILIIVIDSFVKPRDVRKGCHVNGYYIEVKRLFWNCLEKLNEVKEYTDEEIDEYPFLNEEKVDDLVAKIKQTIKK